MIEHTILWYMNIKQSLCFILLN